MIEEYQRMRGAGSADIYVRLLAMAEKRPEKAIQIWLSNVSLGQSSSATVLATHQRGLRRLINQARQWVKDDRTHPLEVLIAQAEARISQALRAVGDDKVTEAGHTFTLAPRRDRLVTARTSAPREPSYPADLARLQEVAHGWSSERWLLWLANGFRTLQSGDAPPHLAFAPIRLYPVGRYIEQLNVAIAEASECFLGVAEDIHQSVKKYLVTGKPVLKDGCRFDPLFWRVYAQSGQVDHGAAVPQSYLDWFSQSPAQADVDEVELVGAICDAAFQTVPSPSSQAWLFEIMQERFNLPQLDASLIIALLNEAQRDIALSIDPVSDAAANSLEILRDGESDIEPDLDDLLKQGRLERHGELAFGVLVEDAMQLKRALNQASRRPSNYVPERPSQPVAVPLIQTIVYELAA